MIGIQCPHCNSKDEYTPYGEGTLTVTENVVMVFDCSNCEKKFAVSLELEII